jgi:hypothetical protein
MHLNLATGGIVVIAQISTRDEVCESIAPVARKLDQIQDHGTDNPADEMPTRCTTSQLLENLLRLLLVRNVRVLRRRGCLVGSFHLSRASGPELRTMVHWIQPSSTTSRSSPVFLLQQ